MWVRQVRLARGLVQGQICTNGQGNGCYSSALDSIHLLCVATSSSRTTEGE